MKTFGSTGKVQKRDPVAWTGVETEGMKEGVGLGGRFHELQGLMVAGDRIQFSSKKRK